MSTHDTAPEPDEAADDVTRFVVDWEGEPRTFELVMNKITFGEAAAFEKVTDLAYTSLAKNPDLARRMVVMQAMLWISMKRQFPTMLFKQVGDIVISSVDWPDTAVPDPDGADDGEQETSPDGVPVVPTVGAVAE